MLIMLTDGKGDVVVNTANILAIHEVPEGSYIDLIRPGTRAGYEVPGLKVSDKPRVILSQIIGAGG